MGKKKRFVWPEYKPKQGVDRILIDTEPSNIDIVATELSRLSHNNLVVEHIQLVCDEAAGILRAILLNGFDKRPAPHKRGR